MDRPIFANIFIFGALGMDIVRWPNAAILAILAAAIILAIVFVGVTYSSFETLGIIPDRIVGIDIALPRVAVIVGVPSALTILLVLIVFHLRYKLSVAIQRK